VSASIYAKQLRAAADELLAAVEHLKFSSDSVAPFVGVERMEDWSPEALEKIEAFTSRFARVVDLLIHRVLRSIDFYELQEPGTLLDVANRAERRGLVDSVDWLREMKDARNRIAHDYTGERLPELLSFCQSEMNTLLRSCDKTVDHIEQLL
jgi:hypothetical protein